MASRCDPDGAGRHTRYHAVRTAELQNPSGEKVPLSCFYFRDFTDQPCRKSLVMYPSQVVPDTLDDTFSPCFVVLVGMQIPTREIENWTWKHPGGRTTPTEIQCMMMSHPGWIPGLPILPWIPRSGQLPMIPPEYHVRCSILILRGPLRTVPSPIVFPSPPPLISRIARQSGILPRIQNRADGRSDQNDTAAAVHDQQAWILSRRTVRS